MLLSVGLIYVTPVNILHSIYYLRYFLPVNMLYLEVVDVPCYGQLLPTTHHVSNTGITGINNKPFLFVV